MKKSMSILALACCISCGGASSGIVSKDVTSKIPKELVKLLFEDICTKGCSDEEVALWKSNLKHRLEDLNGDAVPEFFLWVEHSDWCGAGSNCSYWIYQKAAGGYALLLEDKVLRAKDTNKNGYRDLASETPMGFCDQNVQRLYITPYRYDGKEYRAQRQEVECRAFTPNED